MPNKVKVKRTYSAGVSPTAAELGPHEFAVNWADGIVYVKGPDGTIQSVALGGSGGGGSYALPTASSGILGGIKVGANLTITDGVLAATGGGGGSASVVEAATYSALPSPGAAAIIYITRDTSKIYRFDVANAVYFELSGDSYVDSLLRSLFVPGAPTSVTASAGNAQATVSWTAPTGVISQAPVTDYVVQYSSGGGYWYTFSDGTSTATTATVTGLTNGTAYTFRVAAVNVVGTGSYSSASAAVTPAAGNIIQTTSGLYAWYDTAADDTLYSASSGGTLVTANGDVVNRIRDKSGNGVDLKNFFGGGAATLVTSGQNGKNCVLFDNRAGGGGLQTTQWRESGVFYCSNPLTIFAVWKPFYDGSLLVDDVRYSGGDRETGSAVNIGLQAGRARMRAYSTDWIESGSGRTNNWICQRALMNGTSSKLFVNGVYQAPLGGGNSTSDTPSGMNFNLPSGDWKTWGYHQLGEVVFYQGALSDSTAAAIDSYLMTKWGIS